MKGCCPWDNNRLHSRLRRRDSKSFPKADPYELDVQQDSRVQWGYCNNKAYSKVICSVAKNPDNVKTTCLTQSHPVAPSRFSAKCPAIQVNRYQVLHSSVDLDLYLGLPLHTLQ